MIKFYYGMFNKTFLYLAIRNDNIDVVKMLLKVPGIDVNKKSI